MATNYKSGEGSDDDDDDEDDDDEDYNDVDDGMVMVNWRCRRWQSR